MEEKQRCVLSWVGVCMQGLTGRRWQGVVFEKWEGCSCWGKAVGVMWFGGVGLPLCCCCVAVVVLMAVQIVVVLCFEDAVVLLM